MLGAFGRKGERYENRLDSHYLSLPLVKNVDLTLELLELSLK